MARLNPFCVALFVFLFSPSDRSYAKCNSNDAKARCFSNNSDILGGRTALLQNDDLVFNGILVFHDGLGTPFTGGGGWDLHDKLSNFVFWNNTSR
jgi:hypothetical protein